MWIVADRIQRPTQSPKIKTLKSFLLLENTEKMQSSVTSLIFKAQNYTRNCLLSCLARCRGQKCRPEFSAVCNQHVIGSRRTRTLCNILIKWNSVLSKKIIKNGFEQIYSPICRCVDQTGVISGKFTQLVYNGESR